MRLRLHFLSILLFTFFTSFSQVQTINVGTGMNFDPDTATINLGDTIEFGPLAYHNAVEVDESTWIANGTTSNGGFDFPLGSSGGYFIADSAKTYYYVCQPHATMGMKGVIIVNPPSPPPVPGCTDSLACNYDPLATVDDSSCILPDGCTDTFAFNFDSLAVCDNGSCIYVENLFFSEYGEGSSNNKYFEIYNPTQDTIDLTNYAFARVSNAPTTIGVYEYWVNFDSGAVILPHDVYVVAHPSADPLIIAEADMDYGSLSNGDDGFALVFGTQPNSPVSPNFGGYIVLDWIGDWNGDPGLGWDVAGVTAATRNHTLIRKCPVSEGEDPWIAVVGTNPGNSDWIVRPNNYWNNIGSHIFQITSYDSVSYTICNGLSVTIGNNTYDSSGVYFDTLSAANGCDSIVTTSLTVLSTSASVIVNNITICDGDSVVIGSNTYDNTGTYIDTLLNAAGCDSVITTNLTVQTPIYQDITICDGDSISVGSSVYTTAGSYTDTISSSFGCDSIVHTNLTIYSQFNSIFAGMPNNNVGGGDFYSGSQYLEMSCYISSELVSAVVYAEDTVAETFEIRDDNGNVLDDTLVTVIPGGHRVYFNYHMSAGLDYELGVNGNSNDLFRSNAGVNYPYNFGSLASVTSSSAGGNYYYFFYDIEVRQSSQPTNYSICDGDSIVVAGSVYNATGLYTDSLTSSIGCDSLVLTNLIVYPNVSYINNQTICFGEVYMIGNNTYDSTGTYVDTFSTQYGCDSIVTTNLTVLTISGGVGVNNQTICLGDTISIGTSMYYNPGTYSDTLVSSNGCDSILTTNLSVLSASYATFATGLPDTSAAPGAFSNYNGYLNIDAIAPSLIKSATVYAEDTNSVTFELRDDNGVVLDDVTHTVYPGSQSLIFNFVVPAGNDFQLGVDGSGGNIGLFRSNAGTGNSIPYPFDIGAVSITSANNNLSTQYYYYYYDIEIMPYAHMEEAFICEGDSLIISANVYHIPGTYVDTLSSSNSCDSIVYINLDYHQTPSLSIQSLPDPPEICLGDNIILEISNSSSFIAYWWVDENDNILLVNSTLIDNPTVNTWYLLSAKDSNDCVVKEDIWVYVDTCVTSVNSLISSDISVYPNPTSGLFNIDFYLQNNYDIVIRVVNSVGEVVYFDKAINSAGEIKKQINLDKLPKGVYFLEIESEQGLFNKKLIFK